MATTSHLGITLVEQAQAQKEVTVNTAFARIDALLNTGAIDKDLATPPGSPAAGDVYIVAASPTGAWTGHAKHVAYFDQTWSFITPTEGLTLWVRDEDKLYSFDGTNWVSTAMAFDATLNALAAYNTNGLIAQIAADTFAGRTLTGTSNRITVTNGSGVSGNPTVDISSAYVAALANGGTGATTAQGAMAALKGVYILGASAAAISCPADTTEDTLATITVPANAMGANGLLRITTAWSYTNSANNKTLRIRFGGISGTAYLSVTQTTSTYAQSVTHIRNAGAVNAQKSGWAANTNQSFTTSNTAPPISSVDTTASTDIVITGQKATGSETLTLEGYLVELIVP